MPEPAESPADSNVAEYVADACRRLAEIILGTVGESCRTLAAAEARELLRVLEQPALIDQARVPATPPRLTRSGGVYIDTSPVTSRRNPLAPEISVSRRDGDVELVTTLSLPYQGPRDRMHGGYAAVLLDHVLWEAVRARTGRMSFTRTLTVTYDRPVPLRQPLRVTGRVVTDNGRKTVAEGQIAVGGEVCVRAEGVWVTPRVGPPTTPGTPPGHAEVTTRA
jgi:acyl-coenzyme A thioesterase PaaI-like protein